MSALERHHFWKSGDLEKVCGVLLSVPLPSPTHNHGSLGTRLQQEMVETWRHFTYTHDCRSSAIAHTNAHHRGLPAQLDLAAVISPTMSHMFVAAEVKCKAAEHMLWSRGPRCLAHTNTRVLRAAAV